MTLTAITSGQTPRYFPFPQPTSASTLPGGSEDRKRQTRGQGEWRVLLKWEAMASYTRCTYSSSRWAASAWQQGSEGGDGEGTEGAPWLSQAEGKAGERERKRGGRTARSTSVSIDSSLQAFFKQNESWNYENNCLQIADTFVSPTGASCVSEVWRLFLIVKCVKIKKGRQNYVPEEPRFSPQRQGPCLILRKVKEVRVPLLLKVRLLWVPRSGVAWAGDCWSQAGTMSNFRGVILRGDKRPL